MSDYEHLRVERDDRGVVTVTFDLADRPVNVFGEELFRDLAGAVEDLHRDSSARLIVFRSAKDTGFVVGADVHRIKQISNTEQAEFALKTGQDLFQGVADLRVPTVAVIHGNCLGGGLEFALACTYRIARNDASTRLGLPETQLGLLPGWGGTQRLPRQVGLQRAIGMILTASTLSAAKAKKAGLVDAVASPETFDKDVAAFINERLADKPLPKVTPRLLSRLLEGTSPGRALVFKMAHRKIAKHAQHYPALPAALRAIETGLREGMQRGLAKEREEFCGVLFTPTCRSLLGLFFQREQARSRSTWVTTAEEDLREIKTVAVLGAGTMGAGIAQLAATKGFQVVLKDIDEPAVRQGRERIESLTHKGVQKGALRKEDAERALAALTTTTDMEPVTRVQLVIEAVVERMDVKQRVFRELDERLPAETLLVSNTSSLSISEMASVTGRRDRVAGLHFFNPVHKMPLVEVVRTAETSEGTIGALVDVVKALGKTPIVVAEGPGFLVNRVLFPYFDEAVRLVAEGHPIADVDREAKRFGMPMGPLELLDTVGIDVAADVAGHLPVAGTEKSPTPAYLADLVSQGRLGQKAGSGFYQYKRGRRRAPVTSSVAAGTPQLSAPADFAGETVSGVQQRLILSLINAAAECLHAGIVSEAWMVDLGMVLGTGFAPFRGGPLRLVDTWGRDNVLKTLDGLSDLCGPRFQPSAYFSEPEPAAQSTAPHNRIGV